MTYRVLFSRALAITGFLLSACIFPAQAAESWRIIEIQPEGRVHLREAATSRSRILAYIPGDARGLRHLGCSKKWCKTEFRGMKGWVYSRYLAPDETTTEITTPRRRDNSRNASNSRSANSRQFDQRDMAALSEAKILRVFNPVGKAVSVYAFPSNTLPIAGKLNEGTTSVEGLGACVKGWCYIRSGPLIGWLPSLILTPAHDGSSTNGETTAAIRLNLSQELSNEQAINGTINTATQALPDTPYETARLVPQEGNKYYSLAGLAGKETLDIRSKPSERSRVLGQLDKNEDRIEELKDCSGKWCLVRANGIRGWIERRHMADPELSKSLSYKVSGLPLWTPLDVLDQPRQDADIIGEIPSYAASIAPIGECNQDLCHVRYLGIAGWVQRKYLRAQQ
ncbi:MAG: SH3 domain-containing protein [Hyphomicrobiales bacterium]|nr:SH3 domain-containing protein [Hyphomicrobiales bacterium]